MCIGRPRMSCTTLICKGVETRRGVGVSKKWFFFLKERRGRGTYSGRRLPNAGNGGPACICLEFRDDFVELDVVELLYGIEIVNYLRNLID